MNTPRKKVSYLGVGRNHRKQNKTKHWRWIFMVMTQIELDNTYKNSAHNSNFDSSLKTIYKNT